jgi:hypothetical protein
MLNENPIHDLAVIAGLAFIAIYFSPWAALILVILGIAVTWPEKTT